METLSIQMWGLDNKRNPHEHIDVVNQIYVNLLWILEVKHMYDL